MPSAMPAAGRLAAMVLCVALAVTLPAAAHAAAHRSRNLRFAAAPIGGARSLAQAAVTPKASTPLPGVKPLAAHEPMTKVGMGPP